MRRSVAIVAFGVYLLTMMAMVTWFLVGSAMLSRASWSVIHSHKEVVIVLPLLCYFSGRPTFAHAVIASVLAFLPALILSLKDYWLPGEGVFFALLEYGPLLYFSPICLWVVRECRAAYSDGRSFDGKARHIVKGLRFSLGELLGLLTYISIGAAAYRCSSEQFVRMFSSKESRQFLSMSAEPARDHLEWVLSQGLYALPIGCAGWAIATSRPLWLRLVVYFMVAVGSCLVTGMLPFVCGTPHEMGVAGVVKKGLGIYYSILRDVLYSPWIAAGDHWNGVEFLAIFAAVLFLWLELLRPIFKNRHVRS